jgi:hypothetical protein
MDHDWMTNKPTQKIVRRFAKTKTWDVRDFVLGIVSTQSSKAKAHSEARTCQATGAWVHSNLCTHGCNAVRAGLDWNLKFQCTNLRETISSFPLSHLGLQLYLPTLWKLPKFANKWCRIFWRRWSHGSRTANCSPKRQEFTKAPFRHSSQLGATKESEDCKLDYQLLWFGTIPSLAIIFCSDNLENLQKISSE